MIIEDKLNISEIFYSIQGEGSRAGLPCVFVRLQGCMLRCSWCDTPYALELKQVETMMSIDELIEKIAGYDCNFVELTGGEPLAQENVYLLIEKLLELGYEIAIETNGHADVSKLNTNVIKIMDIKCPDSSMSRFNNYNNINYLSKIDDVKFVIASKNDFDWAIEKINEFKLVEKVNSVILSPVFGKIELEELAELILASKLKIKMQLQMHKYIWHPDKRGV